MEGKHDVHHLSKFRDLVFRIPKVFILVAITCMIVGFALLRFYFRLTDRVIDLKEKKSCYFYIHTGSVFEAVKDSLVKKGYLTDPEKFEWLAQRKNYDQHIKPGRYRLMNGMRNNELVNLLRSGNQEPVKIVIQNVRTNNELAGKIGKYLEIDSTQLMERFTDTSYLARFDLTPPTLFVLFVPDTYEFYWNTSVDQLFERMQREYEHFWNSRRRHQADSLHLSKAEVVSLASIVEKESNKNEEKPVIAGVYINRLKKQIPLQADPTVIFALNDYRIRRVIKKHTEIKSPYNTYYFSGLPPGPICLPSKSSVDAVLHAADHSYLYFCAREDFSGYHNFAADLKTHNRNAQKYQKALNKMNIK
ncbi:MAG: endolytic transglycosylase MltG [Bacteroidales bacterium]|nr:endolytic transglycosylase MltG [Bacteroidales bacterium]